jgi:4-amino-4-deoxy-L-arabinose transferase-like glycosyltransferase
MRGGHFPLRNKGMFHLLNHRAGHYALLLAVTAALCFPNLGGPSLWDIDEGNNAEAAREMLESDNWVVPTFNGQLRVDKPALLYWLQLGAYEVFGVNEFAARLPSALAALATVLLAYELGRRMFESASTGLLGGLILASSVAFCAAARFANPDALLNLFTVLSLLLFWIGYARGGRMWFVPPAVSMGLAVLAKGPVGVVLPLTVIGLFLLWTRQLRRLFDRRIATGTLAFLLVAVPWYAWVGVETKAAFLRGFFLTHHLDRFLHPMENHKGAIYYYPVVLTLGFLPWSAFLGLSAWYSLRRPSRSHPEETASRSPGRFLWCWIAVYFVFFSIAGTKLPNYILPLYAPVALLTAHFLDRWRRGVLQPPGWAVGISLACLGLLGVGTTFGLLAASGAVTVPRVPAALPGMSAWALIGLVPLVAAVGAGWCLWRQRRNAAVVLLASMAVVFLGLVAGGGSGALESRKAPRALTRAFQAEPGEADVRVGCYQYFQPSLVFYAGREVQNIASARDVVEFLRCPLPVYVFVPATVWENELQTRIKGPCRLLGRRRDLYRNCEVVVVTNR